MWEVSGVAERDDVIELFNRGMPPSRIDRELCLKDGTAKKHVINWWLEDKAQHERERVIAARRGWFG